MNAHDVNARQLTPAGLVRRRRVAHLLRAVVIISVILFQWLPTDTPQGMTHKVKFPQWPDIQAEMERLRSTLSGLPPAVREALSPLISEFYANLNAFVGKLEAAGLNLQANAFDQARTTIHDTLAQVDGLASNWIKLTEGMQTRSLDKLREVLEGTNKVLQHTLHETVDRVAIRAEEVLERQTSRFDDLLTNQTIRTQAALEQVVQGALSETDRVLQRGIHTWGAEVDRTAGRAITQTNESIRARIDQLLIGLQGYTQYLEQRVNKTRRVTFFEGQLIAESFWDGMEARVGRWLRWLVKSVLFILFVLALYRALFLVLERRAPSRWGWVALGGFACLLLALILFDQPYELVQPVAKPEDVFNKADLLYAQVRQASASAVAKNLSLSQFADALRLNAQCRLLVNDGFADKNEQEAIPALQWLGVGRPASSDATDVLSRTYDEREANLRGLMARWLSNKESGSESLASATFDSAQSAAKADTSVWIEASVDDVRVVRPRVVHIDRDRLAYAFRLGSFDDYLLAVINSTGQTFVHLPGMGVDTGMQNTLEPGVTYVPAGQTFKVAGPPGEDQVLLLAFHSSSKCSLQIRSLVLGLTRTAARSSGFFAVYEPETATWFNSQVIRALSGCGEWSRSGFSYLVDRGSSRPI